MKTVCFVAPRFPYPENGGDVALLNDIMQYFKNIGWRVILLACYTSSQSDLVLQKYENVDEIYGVRLRKPIIIWNCALSFLQRKPIQCGYYYSQTLKKTLQLINERIHPDLFVCHLARMVPVFLKCKIVDNVIVQMTDILSDTYSMSASSQGAGLKKIIYKYEKKPMYKLENKIINDFNKVVLVSERDCNRFSGKKNVVFHNNGIRSIRASDNYDSNKIVLSGHLNTLQNIDSIVYFVNDIFPLILESIPQAVLYLVGADPTKKIEDLASSHIKITGRVDSIQDFINNAAINVAPIRVASGIQNKVIQAMASGVPNVLTSLPASGIPQLVSGVNCYIEDDPRLFANRCVELMTTQEKRMEFSRKALEIARKEYYWDIHLQGYEKFPS